MTTNWLGTLKRKLTVMALALALPAMAFSYGGCNDLGSYYGGYGDSCCGYYDDYSYGGYYYDDYYYADDYYYDDGWDFGFDFGWW